MSLRTWDGPQFKGRRVTTKQLRARKAGRLKSLENKHKETVRLRDRRCRVPLCGCDRRGLHLDVSHQTHKGIGGDPSGERSQTLGMVYVCNWRHKEAPRVAIDKKTLRWVPLTDRGSDGLIAWEVRAPELGRPGWVEIAREVAIQEWAPFTADQLAILKLLGEMIL